jgi:hypothetical protein
MSVSRVLVSSGGVGGSVYVPSSAKVDDQSLCDLQEVKKLYCSMLSVIVYLKHFQSVCASQSLLEETG